MHWGRSTKLHHHIRGQLDYEGRLQPPEDHHRDIDKVNPTRYTWCRVRGVPREENLAIIHAAAI
jgi:hypothetical protein